MKRAKLAATSLAFTLMLATSAAATTVSGSFVADNNAVVVLEQPAGNYTVAATAIPSWPNPQNFSFNVDEQNLRGCRMHVIAWGDGSVAQGIAVNFNGDSQIYSGQPGFQMSSAPNSLTNGFPSSTMTNGQASAIIAGMGVTSAPGWTSPGGVGTGGIVGLWGPVTMTTMGDNPQKYPGDFRFIWDSEDTNGRPADYRVATIPCTAVVNPPPPPPDVPGDHYQCYDIVKAENLKPEKITVRDQFGRATLVLGRPVMLCNPSEKVHRDREFKIEDEKKHYVCYNLLRQTDAKRQKVEISNQFQIDGVRVAERRMFCVPSYKKH